MIERLEFLSESLMRHAQEKKEASKNEDDSQYMKGCYDGSALAYELCSKWINEILEESFSQ